jgi:hypothetical protein
MSFLSGVHGNGLWFDGLDRHEFSLVLNVELLKRKRILDANS